MMYIQRVAHHMNRTLRAQGEHLSATQQLTLRGLGLFAVVLGVAFVVGQSTPSARAASDTIQYTGTAISSQFTSLRQSLDTVSGELELARIQLDRAQSIIEYSARYQVAADLTTLIYDTAIKEGIDPDLAFRLVRIESGFEPIAASHAGALGLAQVQLRTARFYERDLTAEQLFDPVTNLTIGFRYLHDLMRIYGNVELALLAYNRGPSRLKELLDSGRDPRNGYAASVMKGYTGLQ